MEKKPFDQMWVKAAALVAFVVIGLMFSADPEDRAREREASLAARMAVQGETTPAPVEADTEKSAEKAAEKTDDKPEAAKTVETVSADDIQMTSHRGLYNITLKSAVGGSGISGAKGTMAYNFANQCEGWTIENYTRLTLDYGERGGADNDWRFVSWEAKDGSNYRFRVRQDQDGMTVEELKGSARIGAGQAGKAVFVEPDNTEITLPKGALFPTSHIRQLLAAAKRGETSFPKVMFDGASLENPYEVSAMIRPGKGTENPLLAGKDGEKERTFWKIHMAFFHLNSKESVPAFELSVNYRDDGIADYIYQDFGDFALTMKLTELELTEKPDC